MPESFVSFEEFDPDSVGVTQAFNTALSAGVAVLGFPRRYTFLERPNQITNPVRLIGAGHQVAALVRGYQPSEPNEGFIQPATSYINVESLDIVPGDGTNGGCGVKMTLASNPAKYGNWSWFRDLRLVPDVNGAGTGAFKYAVYLDGDDSSAAPGAPGLRGVVFNNCWLRVPCSAAHLYAKTVRQFRFSGECDNEGVIVITGGDYQSQNVRLDMDFGGILFADRVVNITFTGAFNRGWLKPSVDRYAGLVTCARPWIVQSPKGVLLGPPTTGSPENKCYVITSTHDEQNQIAWDGITPFELADGAYLKEVV